MSARLHLISSVTITKADKKRLIFTGQAKNHHFATVCCQYDGEKLKSATPMKQ
jgi:hypothetical protein